MTDYNVSDTNMTAEAAPVKVRIDLNAVNSVSELHDRIAEELPVPEYYGRNLDALNDFLTSFFTPAVITFEGYDTASEGDYGKLIKNLRRVCTAAEAENEFLTFVWE